MAGRLVRHYLQDVGSTFGTGALGPHEWSEGYEHIYEGDKTWKRAISFGFYLSPWQTVPYEESDSVGRFEGDQFQPERWKPRVPVKALRMARADDSFWAARRVMAFTDDLLRAIVKTAEYSNPASETLLADVLIKRRDKIGRTYLTSINPLVDFVLDRSGTLQFENAAVQTGMANAPRGGYQLEWFRFDNTTGEAALLARSTTPATSASLPPEVMSQSPEYLQVEIRAVDAAHPSWMQPVRVHFRRSSDGWRLVGVDRLPA